MNQQDMIALQLAMQKLGGGEPGIQPDIQNFTTMESNPDSPQQIYQEPSMPGRNEITKSGNHIDAQEQQDRLYQQQALNSLMQGPMQQYQEQPVAASQPQQPAPVVQDQMPSMENPELEDELSRKYDRSIWGQALAGLGDAISRSYGGINSDFLKGTIATQHHRGDKARAADQASRSAAVKNYLQNKNRIDNFEDDKKLLEIKNKNSIDLQNLKNKNATNVANIKSGQKLKLNSKELGQIQDYDDSMAKMEELIKQLGDNSNWTGLIDGRVPDSLLKDPKEVGFRSATGRAFDAYKKLISGTASSDNEMKTLLKRFPEITDTYSNFKAKAESIINDAKKGKSRYLDLLSSVGKSTEKYNTNNTNNSDTNTMPNNESKTIIRRVFAEKENKTVIFYSDGTKKVVDGKQ